MSIETYYKNYLSHHGIKGQKWGVRRYQNEDGSVTSKGAQRYYSEYGDNYHVSDDPKNRPGMIDSKYQNEDGSLSEKGQKKYKKISNGNSISIAEHKGRFSGDFDVIKEGKKSRKSHGR